MKYPSIYDRRSGRCVCLSRTMPFQPQLRCKCGSSPWVQQSQQDVITLKGNDDQVVAFPWYLQYVSPTISGVLEGIPIDAVKNIPIPVSYPSSLLQTLSKMVSELPSAARSVYGRPTGITNVVYPEVYPSKDDVSGSIILENSFVKQGIRVYVPAGNAELGELLRLVHFLGIRSLENALTSFIADRVYPSIEKVVVEGENPLTVIGDLNRILLNEGFGDIPKLMGISIMKYIYLRKIGVEERTIADLIGLEGQPTNVNGTIRWNYKGLSSLSGLNLIVSKEAIQELYLGHNNILGSDVEPEVYRMGLFQGLIKVKVLILSDNQIMGVKKGYFQGLESLEFLGLTENHIVTLGREAFRGMNSLKKLTLSDNRIVALEHESFQGLSNLSFLYLDNNQIMTLAHNTFEGMSLSTLDITDNFILGTEESFRVTYGLEGLNVLYFSPQNQRPSQVSTGTSSVPYQAHKCTFNGWGYPVYSRERWYSRY